MSFTKTSYVSKIGLPGEGGTLSIAHSTLADCEASATTAIKVVNHGINNFTVEEEYFDGLTINIFFSEPNTVFDSSLKLKLGDTVTHPIICSMLHPGTSTQGDNAIFSYPYQSNCSIITFVYRALTCWINNVHYDDDNPYYVQQAINARPTQKVLSGTASIASKRDFNSNIYTKNLTVEIQDLTVMNNGMTDITTSTSGILEVIPTNDSNVIQRVTTKNGDVYQREKYETNQQSSQVKLASFSDISNIQTKQELQNPINPPSPIVFAEAMPSLPESGDVRYGLEVQASPTGYGFHFQPIT